MRELLVFGDKTFKIRVPDYAQVTFGPFSPPPRGGGRNFGEYPDSAKAGTLRVYGRTKKDILACFAGVRGFRDLSIGYAEEVAREEGAVLWKDDEKGYTREDKVKRSKEWIEGEVGLLPPAKGKRK